MNSINTNSCSSVSERPCLSQVRVSVYSFIHGLPRVFCPNMRPIGVVAPVLLHSGRCQTSFWPSVPSLQVAPSFACSVASLSQSPGLTLPGCQHLHAENLADYLLGWGNASTQSGEA